MIDKLSKQFLLEETYNKNQQVKKIKEFVKEFLTVSISPGEKDRYRDFLDDLITHMIIHKRATVSTLVGILRLGRKDSLQDIADLLDQAVEDEWVTWDEEREELITRFSLDKDTVSEMDKYMFPLPLIIKPATVENWNQSGYYSNYSKHLKGVTGVKKCGDICLDILNIQNGVALYMEERVFKHAPVYLKKIHGEKNAWKKRQKLGQFKKFTSSTSVVMEEITKDSNEFFLTHFYDKRGRLYCRAYHANYQGFDWQKAYITLANKEVITND